VSVLAGPFVIAAALLVIGGALKAVRPGDTAHALTEVLELHLPSFVRPRQLVRLGGALEAVVGVGALVAGGPVFAALVSASYLAFTGFVVVALRSGKPISSCGCFGKVDTPPSVVHVVIDLAAAAVAGAAVFTGGVALPDTVADQPLHGVPFLLLSAIGLYLVFLSFTSLPKTMAAVREFAR
jgi:methylamine utilization protein MauE